MGATKRPRLGCGAGWQPPGAARLVDTTLGLLQSQSLQNFHLAVKTLVSGREGTLCITWHTGCLQLLVNETSESVECKGPQGALFPAAIHHTNSRPLSEAAAMQLNFVGTH